MFSDKVLFANRYRLIAHLGPWDLGVEYSAAEIATGRQVVVKVVSPQFVFPGSYSLVAEQFNKNRKLNHPNISSSLELLVHGNDLLIVSDFYSSGTLSDYIAEMQRHPIDLKKISACLNPLISALSYAHAQGVVHADLRPDKIRMGSDGKWKITDFGYSHVLHKCRKDQMDRQLVMKASDELYKAPEVLSGKECGPKVDIYSLGLISFQLFGGNFPSFTIRQLVTMKWDWERPFVDLPIIHSREVQDLLLKSTLNDPDKRLQSLGDFISTLN